MTAWSTALSSAARPVKRFKLCSIFTVLVAPCPQESVNKDLSEEVEDQGQEKAEGGFFNCGKTWFNEVPVPDFISPQLSIPSAKLPTFTSDNNIHPVSETHDFPEFEMNEGEVLHGHGRAQLVFQDQQSSSDRPSSQDAVEEEPSRGTSLGDDDQGLKTYQAEPESTCTAGGLDCEQEVSLECSHHGTEGEKSMYSSVKHKVKYSSGAGSSSFQAPPPACRS
ncbi:unnamed protein product [Coregonus sp. 'balchen']|nr:unnamed protein product [Coregonus sp. 'balchen']